MAVVSKEICQFCRHYQGGICQSTKEQKKPWDDCVLWVAKKEARLQ